MAEKDFFDFLKKRKKWLDGVCITGGEPAIQRDLLDFCRRIKEMGFVVKVDTNGSNPRMLKKLLEEKLVDYVAMDIKSPFEDYPQMVKVKSQKSKVKSITQNSQLIEEIKKSVKLLLESGVDFELRTTVVPGLHTEESLVEMAKQVKEQVEKVAKVEPRKTWQVVEKIKWFLQKFRAKNCLEPEFNNIKPYSDEEMLGFVKKMKKVMPGARVRGEG